MIPYKSVHFIGVLTPEMASLATYTAFQNIQVTASDDHRDSVFLPRLLKAGIAFHDMFAQLNISRSIELVVLSRYADVRHIEAETATRHNIPIMLEVDYMKLISQEQPCLAILGDDYQTRLTAAILECIWREAHIPVNALTKVATRGNVYTSLAIANRDADQFIIPFSGFKHDTATYEADFSSFEAQTIMIPSILYDYPELNTTLDDVYQSYYAFVKRIPRKGLIIGNGDYSRMKRLRSHLVDRHIESYGFERDNGWHIRDVTFEDGMTQFFLWHNQREYGPFTIPTYGRLYVYCATAVAVMSLLFDIKLEVINRGLANLPCFRRFMEPYTDKEGRIIIDDQADHPEIIESVLSSIRERFPDKKIWCLYQPGSYLRTKALYHEFQSALAIADFVYMTDILGYPKEKSEGLNIRHLISDMKRTHPQTYYFDDTTDMSGLLSDRVASTDCIVTLGVDGFCQEIITSLLPQNQESAD